jgi:hypothetical protein
MLRGWDTLGPWIFMSNGTHLSNVAGDKKERLLYMTFGNPSSKIRQTPSTQSFIMFALRPIPINNGNILQQWLDEQWQIIREVMKEVLRIVLQPITFRQHPSAERGYYNIVCADANFRLCKPVLGGWLAHCPEYSDLHHLERHVCYLCECRKKELGDYVHPDKQHPWQDHNLHRMLRDANTKAADAKLWSGHVHRRLHLF